MVTPSGPLRRLRPCAVCGTPSDRWWCSTACRIDDDGLTEEDEARYDRRRRP